MYTLKIKLQGEKNRRKDKQRNKCRKKYNRFLKKLKLYKREKKKTQKTEEERKTPQNCKSPMYRQRFITTIKKCDWGKKKSSKLN